MIASVYPQGVRNSRTQSLKKLAGHQLLSRRNVLVASLKLQLPKYSRVNMLYSIQPHNRVNKRILEIWLYIPAP